jgi:hypothetical protein
MNKHKDVTKSIVEQSTGWDEWGDYGDVIFYNAVLATDTAKFKRGDMVHSIAFCYSKGIVDIYSNDGKEVLESFEIQIMPIFK